MIPSPAATDAPTAREVPDGGRPRARWVLGPAPEAEAAAIAAALDLHPLAALLLARRGSRTPEEATRFLRPGFDHLRDPDLLPGMDAAAARVAAAVRGGEIVAVHGDYDVDGICGTALLATVLRAAGATVVPYIPDRRAEGYGLGEEAVRRLAAQGVGVMITVDHGSRAVEEIALAKGLGIDTVVTDHHLVGDGPAPGVVALVNPHAPAPDGTPAYPFPWLCGTGVAFKLAWAVGRRLHGGRIPPGPVKDALAEALTLVALATVADVVPLVDENRAAVVHGLRVLPALRSPGLRALLESAGVRGRAPDAEDVAFRLAPRINAAGRLGDAGRALELLTTADPERARELAAVLEEENEARRALDQRVAAEARALVPLGPGGRPPAGIVLASDGWHPGVVGIVAARIAEEFHRPAVVVAMEGASGRGSARSVSGFHLERALAACGEHLVAHGGHAAAAGLEVERSRLPAFAAAFDAHAERHLSAADRVPRLDIDARVRLDELRAPLVRTLARLGPHGHGNPAPLLAAVGVEVVGEPRHLGKGGAHLSFHVRAGEAPALRAVWFGAGRRLEEVRAARGAPFHVAFRPQINAFRGAEEVELLVRDVRTGDDPLES